MQWEVLIIPLIAFGAWILSTIFKAEEAKTKTPPRRAEGVRVPRRPAPVNKVREEPRRRRDVPDGMEARPPLPRRPAPVVATIISEPVRDAFAQPAKVEEAPILLPMSQPVAALPPIGVPQRQLPASPVLQEVVRLLRSPRTAGTAIVLREILDRPHGPRRRR